MSAKKMSIGKKIGIGVGIIAGLFTLTFLQAQRHVVNEYSVIVNASPKEVWDFLSDNKHAKGWSVFFDHITTLPGNVPEGSVGSVRRCFRNADETGFSWDETTVETVPYKYRRIAGANIQGVKSPIIKNFRFQAHQVYEDIAPGKTKLTFKGDLDDWTKYGFVERYVNWVSGFEVERVFKLNLINIKAMIEQGPNYQRPHAWEKNSKFDDA